MKILLGLFFLLAWNPSLHAQTPFYKGKSIRIVVGFTPGGAFDLWARVIVRHWTKHIPGNPELIVQNMPGGASMIAANHVYSAAKPDGLTVGMISPALVFDQLVGRKEVQFDWVRFLWIGSPEQTEDMLFSRTDSPYKTLEDIRKAATPPRCGAIGTGNVSYYFPKLIEETTGLKFQIITGYPGAIDINLALERGEVHCQSSTTTSFFGREPGRTWAKTGFTRALVQSGTRRDPRMPDVLTIWELMEREKTPEMGKRLASVILSPGLFGRPFVVHPGSVAEAVRALRESFMKTMADPELLAEAKKRDWEVTPVSGERLDTLKKEALVQPPEVIERVKKLLGI